MSFCVNIGGMLLILGDIALATGEKTVQLKSHHKSNLNLSCEGSQVKLKFFFKAMLGYWGFWT